MAESDKLTAEIVSTGTGGEGAKYFANYLYDYLRLNITLLREGGKDSVLLLIIIGFLMRLIMRLAMLPQLVLSL